MAKMILVEDESFERNSLMNYIDWSLIGVQVIGEAANGAQGLSLVMELQPDIVLADVKMPVMDGLEMSRRIRNFAPRTKIIFVSSYDDFEYAKQAIDLNIQAYVMKPVNEAELLRVVKKAADEVTERVLEDRLYNKIKNNYSISINLARQTWVNRILTGMTVNEDDVRNLGLEWLCKPNENLCLLLSFYDKDSLDSIDESIDVLNRNCAKICSQSINVCINAGRLITLCIVSPQDAKRNSKAIEEVLRNFLVEKGAEEVRIESVCGSPELSRPSALYNAILKKNVVGYNESVAMVGKTKSKRQIVEEIEKIIQTQYCLPLTLEGIAHAIHLTPNYIGTVFKSVKKVSVNRYLMCIRMEKAETLLRESNLSINDIAEQCGFGSNTYFYTIFKKEKGITPSEFRQGMNGSQEK